MKLSFSNYIFFSFFLVMNKKAPKFQETLDAKSGSRKKKSKSAEYYKLK
jgi:hypothetical protein